MKAPPEQRPFAGFADFAACVAANGDKDDPNAYCGALQAKAEGRTDGAMLGDGTLDDDLLEQGELGLGIAPAAALPDEEARGVDASKQQEVEKAKERDKLIEQENIGLPVPGFGLGPAGPGAGPQGPGGLKAKEARSVREWRELEFMECRAIAEEALPAGTCAIVSGIALRYNVLDDWGTTFAPGCLDLTRAQKVPAGRVQLYVKNTSGAQHTYGMNTLVGTVAKLEDVGDDVVMTAHLADDEQGRDLREKLKAMIAQGGFVGLSIGFRTRKSAPQLLGGKRVQQITEIELMEVSIVPMASVPGTAVLAVRSPIEHEAALRAALHGLPQDRIRTIWAEVFPASRTSSEEANTRARERLDAGAPKASVQDRIAAFRRSFAHGGTFSC